MRLPALLLLSASLHLLLALRLAPALEAPWAGAALAALLAASALLAPAGLLARRWLRPPASDHLTWAGMLFLGLFSSLCVLALLRELALAAGWLAALAGAELPPLARPTAQGVVALALLASLAGFWNARRTARVVRVTLPLPGLHPALEGLRVVQISDVHVGPTIKRGYLAAIVERVNALEPDVVAITGDLVDGPVSELAPHVAPLAQLRARHGVFFVTGNHEYYCGVRGWTTELQRLGIRVLHNEHVLLRRGAGVLALAGVPDFSGHHFDRAHRSDPAQAIAGAPPGALKVLLAHQPRTGPAAAAAGFDLQLSGHTHGGQFFPWSLFVPLQQPYTAGLHKLGGLWIYVSRGTGYWGPPKRLGAPSEIAELQLTGSG